MNYKKYSIAILLAANCLGCHSIKVNNASMYSSDTNPVALGVIGFQKGGILASDFKVSAIPEYRQKIRVGITPVYFGTTTFEAYLRTSGENKQQIKYIDSLENKPRFISLQLLDQVTTITELQEVYNLETIRYLKSQREAAIVTSLSLALSDESLKEICNAETVFLSNGGYKQYQLSLTKNGSTYKTINFTETTIFGYDLSFFCWSENDKKQITLTAIVDEKSSCPKNAYRDAQKALDKMNYFKL